MVGRGEPGALSVAGRNAAQAGLNQGHESRRAIALDGLDRSDRRLFDPQFRFGHDGRVDGADASPERG
jgi:hypothetical protein